MKNLPVAAFALLFTLSSCASVPAAAPTSPPAAIPSIAPLPTKAMSAADLASLKAQVEDVVSTTRGELTSLVVGVWDPVKGVGTAAAGKAVVSPERAASVDDQVRIGSIAKTFIATLVLRAVADGKLALDKTVADYDPDVARTHPEIGTRTLRQLLTMRSGLPDFEAAVIGAVGKNPASTAKVWTTAELIDAAMASGEVGPADGTPAVYCNTNYVILGDVLEKVLGADLHTLVTDQLLTPLGLIRTSYPLAADTSLAEPFSHGYISKTGVKQFTEKGGSISAGTDTTDWSASWGGAAGIMNSTITDLAVWANTDFGSALLPADLAAERAKATSLNVVGAYGMGLQVLGDWSGHTGGIPGWSTLALRDEKTGTVVVMATNSTSDYATFVHLGLVAKLFPDTKVKLTP